MASPETEDDKGQLPMFRPFLEDDVRYREASKTVDISLGNEMPLPKNLRATFPRYLIGRPIRDLDTFYNGKNTFLVISRDWTIHRHCSKKALWFLGPFHPLRWFCIRMTTHWLFRYLTLLVHLFFAAFLAFPNTFTHGVGYEIIFWAYFYLEMITRILARGFLLHPFSYLRSHWNYYDFIPNLRFLTYYSPFTPLRFMKIIRHFTYSRMTFSWMFRCLLLMKDVLCYGAFLFLFFTLFENAKFGGIFHYGCVPQTETNPGNVTNTVYFPDEKVHHHYSEDQGDYSLCGKNSLARRCPENYTCAKANDRNPNYGFTNFDNFCASSMGTLRLMSRDYWEDLFMKVSAVDGPGDIAFFLTVIVYGSYYMINLIVAYLAVGITQLLNILEGKEPKKLSKKDKISMLKAEKLSDGQQDGDKTTPDNGQTDEIEGEQVINEQVNFQEIQFQTTDDGGVMTLNTNEMQTAEPIEATRDDENIGEKTDDKIRVPTTSEANPVKRIWMAFVDSFCEWKCCPCWVAFQKKLSAIVLSFYFDLFIAFCIVLNTVMLAAKHFEMTYTFALALEYTFTIILFIYVIEAILKILALSPKHYFKVPMNVFDFIITLLCLLEWLVQSIGGFAMLRIFRVFRMFHLVRWWPQRIGLIKISIAISLMVFAIASIFALEGIFIFGPFRVNRTAYRWDVQDFPHALLLVVRIWCGEWIENFWNLSPHYFHPITPIFFFFCIIVGNLAIFTLFIALVMTALHTHKLCETTLYEDRNLFVQLKEFFRKRGFSRCCPNTLDKIPSHKSEEKLCEMLVEEESTVTPVQTSNLTDSLEPCCWDGCYRCLPCLGSQTPTSTDSTSFWIKWENMRRHVLRFIGNKYYNIVMNLFILISTIPLCWEDTYYMEYNSILIRFTKITDILVLMVFSLDLILRILGNGCKKYFTDTWSIVDFTITSLHLGAVLLHQLVLIYMLPYSFRLLKLIPRLQHLRVVVSAICYKLHVLSDAFFTCCIFWIFFAIMAVQFYFGAFQHCVDESNMRVEFLIVPTKDLCLGPNYTWIVHRINFDNFAHSTLALLQVATRKGWINILHNAMDAHELLEFQPQYERSYNSSFLFVAFLIVGVLYSFALIIAAFIMKTNEQRKQIMEGYVEILMSDRQRQAYASKKSTLFISPIKVVPKPTSRVLLFIYNVVESPKFTLVIILLILGNILNECIFHYGANYSTKEILFSIDFVFSCLFTLEVILRIVAYRKHYFKDPWNIYDFLLMIACNVGHLVIMFLYIYVIWLPTLFRIARLARWFKPVRRIASRIMALNGALHNIAFLLFIFAVTYSLIATAIFGHVDYDHFHGDLFNFRTFLSSFLIVIQLAFEGGWDGIYENIANENGSLVFVLSYLFLNFLVFIECGTVLFLEHYHLVYEKARLGITDYHLENFAEVWKTFDPDATGFIAYDHLSVFLNTLLPPFHVPLAEFGEAMDTLDIPIYKDDKLAFKDVLLALLSSRDDEKDVVKPCSESTVGFGETVGTTRSRMQQQAV